MNCLLIFSIAAICATVVQGRSVPSNDTQLQLNIIHTSIHSDIQSLEDVINNILEPSKRTLVSRSSEVFAKAVMATINKLEPKLEKVDKENKNVADCFVKAAQNAKKHAARSISPCVEKYLEVHEGAIENITHTIQLNQAIYNWTTELLTRPCDENEGKPEECLSHRLFLSGTAYTQVKEQTNSVLGTAYQAEYDAKQVVNDCVDKYYVTATDLEKLQSEFAACIPAS